MVFEAVALRQHRGNANLGSLETEGYNFGVRYRMPEYSFGTLSFNLDTNYLTSFRQQATKGAAWDDYAGYWNYPRVRGTLASTWTKGDLSATWTMRYYGGFRDYCYDDGVECNEPNYQTPNGGWSGGTTTTRTWPNSRTSCRGSAR